MVYEKFKIIQSKEEFYTDWNKADLIRMSNEIKEYVYQKYLMKCVIFQRDEFKCQNQDCTSEINLTVHHIKFKKNNGKDTPRNGVTLCKSCHTSFHRGKNHLTFWGATYKLHQENDNVIDWKSIKSTGRKFRKTLKEYHGYKISWEMLCILMKFLENKYDDDIDDD